MKNKIKFKIGEFSKLCQVTVKTLRHYEEIGLLAPKEVDEWTGYRYYDTCQLRQMARISHLKRLGFSLDEIIFQIEFNGNFIDQELIKSKIEQCSSQIEVLKNRLKELESTLQKQEKVMEKIFEKSLPARVFATHRRKIESYQDLFNLCPNIIGPEMQRLGCKCPDPQYCFTIEYNKEYGVDIDIEYFEAVEKAGVDSDLIKFKSLPQVPVAICINHYGAYEKMPETFADLFSYAEAKGYEISDHPRFCYIDGIWNKESIDEWLTEIQIPINR